VDTLIARLAAPGTTVRKRLKVLAEAREVEVRDGGYGGRPASCWPVA